MKLTQREEMTAIWWKEKTASEMREFMALCETKHLLRYPGGQTQRFTPDHILATAREIVRVAVQRGWARYPQAVRARSLPANAYVCEGEYLEHDFEFVPGVGDCCARCGAQPTRKHSRANQESALHKNIGGTNDQKRNN